MHQYLLLMHVLCLRVRDEKTQVRRLNLNLTRLPVLVLYPACRGQYQPAYVCRAHRTFFVEPPPYQRMVLLEYAAAWFCWTAQLPWREIRADRNCMINHTIRIRLIIQKSKGLLVATCAFWIESKLSLHQAHVATKHFRVCATLTHGNCQNTAYLRDFE